LLYQQHVQQHLPENWQGAEYWVQVRHQSSCGCLRHQPSRLQASVLQLHPGSSVCYTAAGGVQCFSRHKAQHTQGDNPVRLRCQPQVDTSTNSKAHDGSATYKYHQSSKIHSV
jgi:hypothetical protein